MLSCHSKSQDNDLPPSSPPFPPHPAPTFLFPKPRISPFSISAKKIPQAPAKLSPPKNESITYTIVTTMKKQLSPFIAAPPPHTHHKSTQNHSLHTSEHLALLPILVFPSSIPRRLACAPSTLSSHIFPPCFHIHDQALCAPCTLCAPLFSTLFQHMLCSFPPLLFPFYRTLPLLNATQDPFLARLILVLPSSIRLACAPNSPLSPSFKAISVLI